MSGFLAQDLQRRVINDPSLDRFIWNNHNYSTTYQEPFNRVQQGDSQGYVPTRTTRPVRIFGLNFATMHIRESNTEQASWLNGRPDLDFKKLQQFYIKHQRTKKFIYTHPVYGDLVVRFYKPLSVPKKNPNSVGTVQSFQLELVEVIDTDYIFDKGEDFSPDFNFPFIHYDMEIEYLDSNIIIPLGENYSVVFHQPNPVLRKFKMTIPALRYFLDGDAIILNYMPQLNAAVLEAFYMKYRLDKSFQLQYLGETLNLYFSDPIKIPEIVGNTGQTAPLELSFIEAAYPDFQLVVNSLEA